MILANKDFDNAVEVTSETDAALYLFCEENFIRCNKTVKLEAGGGAYLMVK